MDTVTLLTYTLHGDDVEGEFTGLCGIFNLVCLVLYTHHVSSNSFVNNSNLMFVQSLNVLTFGHKKNGLEENYLLLLQELNVYKEKCGKYYCNE